MGARTAVDTASLPEGQSGWPQGPLQRSSMRVGQSKDCWRDARRALPVSSDHFGLRFLRFPGSLGPKSMARRCTELRLLIAASMALLQLSVAVPEPVAYFPLIGASEAVASQDQCKATKLVPSCPLHLRGWGLCCSLQLSAQRY
jgi:hypothetical protein